MIRYNFINFYYNWFKNFLISIINILYRSILIWADLSLIVWQSNETAADHLKHTFYNWEGFNVMVKVYININIYILVPQHNQILIKCDL